MMPYAPTPLLLVERDGPVTILTLNNPDMRNALIEELHQALQEVWGWLGAIIPSGRRVDWCRKFVLRRRRHPELHAQLRRP